ncbi:MAG: recombinase family protein [Candidatus Izemoplasmatales bacterium]
MIELKEVINYKDLSLHKKKRNVCAYARVSTSSEVQLLSFDTQVSTYAKQIMSNPDWNFVGVYADEGKSGTNITKRTQFNLMIEAARNGLIDLIITKSISRFSRNTLDSIKLIQELKNKNVEVFFEKENISTFDPKIELIMPILSGMAEEESRSISENVKWGNTKRFEKGEFHVVTKRMLGYDHDESGKLVINEQEASTVRKIYEMFLDGVGAAPIMKYLEDHNIPTTFGNKQWSKTAVYGILKNEKYTGNALLQKTYRPSFKSKHTVNNKGELSQFYVVDSHPAIISLAIFNKVQEIRKQKSIKYQKSNIKNMEETFGTKDTPYTGFVRCAHCGKHFNMKVNKNTSSFANRFLQCLSNASKKTCVADTLSCDVIDQEIVNQINLIIKNKNTFINSLTRALNNDERLVIAKQELKATQTKLSLSELKLNEMISETDGFHKAVIDQINKDIYDLKIQVADLQNKIMIDLNVDNYLIRIKSLLKEYSLPINSIEEFPYKKFFSKLIVLERNKIIFVMGKRNDYENINLSQELLYSGSIQYRIRKTDHNAEHGLLFF